MMRDVVECRILVDVNVNTWVETGSAELLKLQPNPYKKQNSEENKGKNWYNKLLVLVEDKLPPLSAVKLV